MSANNSQCAPQARDETIIIDARLHNAQEAISLKGNAAPSQHSKRVGHTQRRSAESPKQHSSKSPIRGSDDARYGAQSAGSQVAMENVSGSAFPPSTYASSPQPTERRAKITDANMYEEGPRVGQTSSQQKSLPSSASYNSSSSPSSSSSFQPERRAQTTDANLYEEGPRVGQGQGAQRKSLTASPAAANSDGGASFSQKAEYTAAKGKELVQRATEGAKERAAAGYETVRDAAQHVSRAAESAYDRSKLAVEEQAESATHGLQRVKSSVVSVAEQAFDRAADVAQEARGMVGGAATVAKEAATDLAVDTRTAVEGAVGRAAASVKHAVKEAATEVKESILPSTLHNTVTGRVEAAKAAAARERMSNAAVENARSVIVGGHTDKSRGPQLARCSGLIPSKL